MNIYQESIIAVENGARFRIDLKTKSLRINRNYAIKNGDYKGTLGIEKDSVAVFGERIEELYHDYKFSIPTEHSEHRKHLLRVLKEHELTDEQLIIGKNRDVSQFKFEYYLLASIINGTLTKDFFIENEKEKFFWQSENDKDLIIYKSYL